MERDKSRSSLSAMELPSETFSTSLELSTLFDDSANSGQPLLTKMSRPHLAKWINRRVAHQPTCENIHHDGTKLHYSIARWVDRAAPLPYIHYKQVKYSDCSSTAKIYKGFPSPTRIHTFQKREAIYIPHCSNTCPFERKEDSTTNTLWAI